MKDAPMADKTYSRRSFLRTACIGGAATIAAGSYPLLIERSLVQVNRYRIRVPHLPSELAGFTIAHLTDLHYGPLVSQTFLEGVVASTNALGCDLIVCTGDYVHERTETTVNEVWPLLRRLRARFGVLSVLGNHDHWTSTALSVERLEASGQSVRHGRRAVVRGGRRLWFAGAGDLWEDHRDLDDTLEDIPDDECRIVLAHNPDTADTGYSRRVDLMIAGHTHGGQVRVPFVGAPVLPVRNKRYSSGLLTASKGHPLFISRGIGWAILPVRCNCFPEIAVLQLHPMGAQLQVPSRRSCPACDSTIPGNDRQVLVHV